jgi:hypothetical protein
LKLKPGIARGMTGNVNILPPRSKLAGLTYGDWAASWWQWILSIPQKHSPAKDNDGKDCAQKQSGPVWFLAGTFDSKPAAERTCAIPAGKAVFFPIITTEKSYVEFPEFKSEAELRSRAEDAIDRVKNVWARVDGTPIENLHQYRVKSHLFSITYVENNVIGLPPRNSEAVAEGYYIMLYPLSTGKHDIHFGGAAFCIRDELQFQTCANYCLTVR